ncbi:hypothetical protein CP985_13545 [Malaciobacter mytili LMG 24559]|uniref:Uncharacterized protein n=1 Tax=Malaciobacter mytili LMG 24559 TaxID=1032238 RepID=A0AAX2AE72_9BACT|nr:putative membrane protein [Malaciobacter mytili LMG 24559]RXK12974.1 hypothetical protein CP985_13545 [Malaciobacter mytili LMG 24559]
MIRILIILIVSVLGNISLMVYDYKHIENIESINKIGMIFNVILLSLLLIELFKISKKIWFNKKEKILKN